MFGRITRTFAWLIVASAVTSAQDSRVADDVIVWSATRKLDWKDFRGKPPAGTLGGALSAISHDYAVGCRDQALQMRVLTIFMPSQSWVTYRIASSGLASRVGLVHEQIHFDLAEVYARRIRKMLRELRDPCPRPDDELMGMAEKVIKVHWDVQRRYDFETENGQIERRQNDWQRKTAGELAALSEFATEVPKLTPEFAAEVPPLTPKDHR